MTTKDSHFRIFDQRDFKGAQSWNREVILSIDQHKCRIEIRHDAYKHQSYARLYRWDGRVWQFLVHIPPSQLATWQGTKPFSYVENVAPNAEWQEDQAELIRLALLVLT